MILVTGGTGFLGKRLVEKLPDVIVFAREEDRELNEKGVKVFTGDIKNKEELEKAFSDIEPDKVETEIAKAVKAVKKA